MDGFAYSKAPAALRFERREEVEIGSKRVSRRPRTRDGT